MSRIVINELEPQAYAALYGVEAYLDDSSLSAELRALLKLRASQINGCSFCINLHQTEIQQLGGSTARINALSDWEESGLFSEAEQAALAATESLTLVTIAGLPEDIYQNLLRYFSENQVAQLFVLVATINAWNRLGRAMTSPL